MSIMLSEEEWAALRNGVEISTKVPKFIDDWASGCIMGYPNYTFFVVIIDLYIRHNGKEKYEEELRKEFKEGN